MVSIEEVRKLHNETQCGLQDCKKALEQAEGDFDKAIDILKEKGKSIAEKRAGNDTKEGIIIAKTSEDRKFGFILSLLSETDFVSRTEDFKGITNLIAEAALNKKVITLEELKELKINKEIVNEEKLRELKIDNETVSDIIIRLISQVRENIELKYTSFTGTGICYYNHFTCKLSSMVSFKNATEIEKDVNIKEVGENIAKHLAGISSEAISIDELDKKIVEKVRKEAEEQSSSVKDEKIKEKIINGKMNKYYKESVLLEQNAVWDESMTIKEYLKRNGDLIINKVLVVRI